MNYCKYQTIFLIFWVGAAFTGAVFEILKVTMILADLFFADEKRVQAFFFGVF